MSGQFKQIIEGKGKLLVPIEKKISKDLPVFYNPLMEYNRSISVALLNALKKKDMQIADPLSGTASRAIRFIKETDSTGLIWINDIDKAAIKLIKKNLALNHIKKGFKITNLDANMFFADSKGFDYIDIDPFGSPNPFLNNAISHLKREGILAVTATDTGALCGTFPEACIRKYWAKPCHNEEMHEIGLRILIRKVQLIGMQFEKALKPILSYDREHYMRIFFICTKSRKECNDIARQHCLYKDAGPIWAGKLKDEKILNGISLKDKFTITLKKELDILGFYDIPTLCKKNKISSMKKIDDIINAIHKLGFKATRTHFSLQGIKSDIDYDKLTSILKTR